MSAPVLDDYFNDSVRVETAMPMDGLADAPTHSTFSAHPLSYHFTFQVQPGNKAPEVRAPSWRREHNHCRRGPDNVCQNCHT